MDAWSRSNFMPSREPHHHPDAGLPHENLGGHSCRFSPRKGWMQGRRCTRLCHGTNRMVRHLPRAVETHESRRPWVVQIKILRAMFPTWRKSLRWNDGRISLSKRARRDSVLAGGPSALCLRQRPGGPMHLSAHTNKRSAAAPRRRIPRHRAIRSSCASLRAGTSVTQPSAGGKIPKGGNGIVGTHKSVHWGCNHHSSSLISGQQPPFLIAAQWGRILHPVKEAAGHMSSQPRQRDMKAVKTRAACLQSHPPIVRVPRKKYIGTSSDVSFYWSSFGFERLSMHVFMLTLKSCVESILYIFACRWLPRHIYRCDQFFSNFLFFPHTYIHTYIHTCMHAYIHTYVRTYVHTYTHTYIHNITYHYITLHNIT